MSKTSTSLPVLVKDVVHKIQLCLLDGIKSETQLSVAASLLSKSDYNDVVTERSIAQMCGYPLCTNSLPCLSPPKKGRYRISLKEHKVYDLLETRMYCSTQCIVDSRTYAESLEDERSLDLDRGKIDKVVKLFEGLSLKNEMGLGDKNDDFGMGKLSIKEKEDASIGIVSMEEWVGPSNAIEGYVPQHDRKRPGSKLKDSKVKSEEQGIFDEMNFMSTIITQEDGYSISKVPSGDSKEKKNSKGTNDKLIVHGGSLRKTQKKLETRSNDNKNKECEIVSNNKSKVHEFPSTDVSVMERAKSSICDKEAEPSCSRLKSSLKSSEANKTNRSVTWADEKSDGTANQTHSGFSRTEKEKEKNMVFDIVDEGVSEADHAFRFASAEACAEALSKAATAVASGELDVPDAFSEAGIVILPPPLDDNEAISEGAVDPEPAPLKWPKKTGIVEADFLDSEDSWFDSPPEEFVLELSPFATMFMSLFAWTSSSTLAYVYGRDDSFHEDYASVNGREYPQKVMLSDGRSSEIKRTLAGCLARALPGLVQDLRLPTPVSTIEFGMGGLLETMSFFDPLPALRSKQWQVIVLLFVEALAVCRIPAVAPHLTNKRSFFQKVFDDGQINRDEYEVLKDLILPLGRSPQLATQSGA
uniref:putative RNA polymerase II subunit B1 CTD phosphatase RPAP2 homolog n=1 Tax=Erigeron canadensis TaxID=72917 RepID=UPI001CB929FD|nr:putative RNA polymerase II subunit B1 CTD phosphatase RPAP2 homolog [Erigeron canadensis]